VRWLSTLISGLLGASLGCGGGAGSTSGGGSSNPPPSSNAVPAIVTVSPNSSNPGGADFVLSVVGTNFISSSTVQWNGSTRQTTFVDNTLLTAQISAADISTLATNSITVLNPASGGGTSNSKVFAVPCDIPPPVPAAGQTRARLGALYFDGWSGPLTNFHFKGLPRGPYEQREPLTGWQDSNDCAVERQLALAHYFGIDFFVHEWYFNTAVNAAGENLNSALRITSRLPDRHGMQLAIMYVNGDPFNVGPADWTSAVNEWVGYMKDPAYLRVNGSPLFIVMNVGAMGSVFGSSAAVTNALNELRIAALTQGLPGVYIVGGFGVPDGTIGMDSLSDGFTIAQNDGYDAVELFGYPFAPPPINGMLPFSTLSDAGHWVWDQARLHGTLPFIPAAMDGWDPRPWDERSSSGELMWYSRTPQEVANFVSDAIDWANSNPQLRPEPLPAPPLFLIKSWNELGEGNHVLPSVEDGTSYGDALAAMLTAP
jgi:hypothetical protein